MNTQAPLYAFWNYFERLSRIPRVTGNEAATRTWIISLAKQWNYRYCVDDLGNVLIKVSAHKSQSSCVYALQAHLDMVGEKTPHSTHDFTRDEIRHIWYTDATDRQEWLKADNTTLGADNGIGVSYILALIDPTLDIAHPALECVFTVEEETGLCGAQALGFADELQATYMINLDNSVEGEICTGCAGGCDIIVEPYDKALHDDYQKKVEKIGCVAAKLTVDISGLCGGHSGADIYDGRENAHNMMLMVYGCLNMNFPLCVVSMHGGDKLNAIPRESHMLAVVGTSNNADSTTSVDVFIETLQAYVNKIKTTLHASLHSLDHRFACSVSIEPLTQSERKSLIASPRARRMTALIDAITLLPRGVLIKKGQESYDSRVTVNLARIDSDTNSGSVNGLARPVVPSASYNIRAMDPLSLKNHLARFKTCAHLLNMDVKKDNWHPPWYTPQHSSIQGKCDGTNNCSTGSTITELDNDFSNGTRHSVPDRESSHRTKTNKGVLAKIIAEHYKTLYEKTDIALRPSIRQLHVAVECGVILNQCPHMTEAVSIGPQIEHLHSPDERVNRASAERCFDLLKAIMQNGAM